MTVQLLCYILPAIIALSMLYMPIDAFAVQCKHGCYRPSSLARNLPFPSRVWGQSALKMGLLDSFKKVVGSADPTEALAEDNDRLLKQYMQRVEKINALEASFEAFSDDELQRKTAEFKSRLQKEESLDSMLVEAFAVVREAAWRVLRLRHFDVQLVGGIALHEGRLAEMATGEGKTLVALLPVYLNALTGESAMVVTTNDYLARRDGETMGQVFRFLGMSVGVVQNYLKEAQRRAAYSCDVTYVANQELGFDFLRDNLAMSQSNVVQSRQLNFCVVDEADSILIDEARTPLIISRKGLGPSQKYSTAAQIADNLVEGQHYEVNLKDQKIELTRVGFKFAEQIVGKTLYDLKDPWAFFIINALKAKALFKRDQEYIVQNGEVAIVDSFTGRVLEGRRFTDGLQQAIEAKERLEISGETQVVAKVTYQNLFRMFPKLSGMTGTAVTDAAEIEETYKLKVTPIPTALPIARRDNPDAVFRTQKGKLKAMLRNVLTNHERGRPILIGTTSVESSEEVVAALKDIGVPAKVLNARPENVERESEIVSQAGRIGAVTVSTNMAGRGTDILLGGSSKGIAKVLAKHMLLVRMGLVDAPPAGIADLESESDVDVATDGIEVDEEGMTTSSDSEEEDVEDVEEETDPDVLALPAVADLAKLLELWLPRQLSKQVELDLKRAVVSCSDLFEDSVGRVEVEDVVSRAADAAPTDEVAVKLLRAAINRMTKEFEAVVKQERERVKKLGGLYVIGTSRHESRRIDNQLRGRSGRQGDPGASRFFLSLEDDIFKIFGADKMSGMLENFRVAEDMPIESELVVQALDKVQQQVEDYFRATRQQVFRLDEVVAVQRNAVYAERREFLTCGDDVLAETFTQYTMKTMDEIYNAALVPASNGKTSPGSAVNADKLVSKAVQFFPNIQLSVQDVSSIEPSAVPALLKERLTAAIKSKRDEIDNVSSWAFVAFFRYLALVQVDESWCKQLTRLDLLKEEMVLQSFTAERDVMEVYEEKASTLYSSLMDDVRRNSVYSLFIYKPTPGK